MDRSARILDLGCGHGVFIYFHREAGYTNVVGVDKSPEQVAEATGCSYVSQGTETEEGRTPEAVSIR
jgi:cyclopropane fatty-acyl-phospholipid synthase-like methyltransferase